MLRDKSGRNLFTVQSAVGVEAAPAQYRLWYGT